PGRGTQSLVRRVEGQRAERGAHQHDPEIRAAHPPARSLSVRALAAALALTLAAGCAAIPRAERDARSFDLVGRILVAFSGGAFSANMRWQHAAADEIALMTPTGQTMAQIVDTGDGATLETSDHKSYSADSVERLTQQAL